MKLKPVCLLPPSDFCIYCPPCGVTLSSPGPIPLRIFLLIPSCIWATLNLQQSALHTYPGALVLSGEKQDWFHLPSISPVMTFLPQDLYLHVGHWQRALQTVLSILLGMSVQERVIHLQRRRTVTPVLALKAAASSTHSRSLGSGVHLGAHSGKEQSHTVASSRQFYSYRDAREDLAHLPML